MVNNFSILSIWSINKWKKKQKENEWCRELRIVAGGKCRSYKVGSYLSKMLNRLFYLPQYMFLHTFTEASVVFGECWTVRLLEWRDSRNGTENNLDRVSRQTQHDLPYCLLMVCGPFFVSVQWKLVGEFQEEKCNDLLCKVVWGNTMNSMRCPTKKAFYYSGPQDTEKQEALRSSRQDWLHTYFLSLWNVRMFSLFQLAHIYDIDLFPNLHVCLKPDCV